MRSLLRHVGLVSAVAFPVAGHAASEAGSAQYRVLVLGPERPLSQADHAALTGSGHPVTALLSRPGEINALVRSCPSCGGYDEVSHAAVRSWSADITYLLGGHQFLPLQPEPGFECVHAANMPVPTHDLIVIDGEERGVATRWVVSSGDETLALEQDVVARGGDFMDSAVEMTIAVTNLSETADADIGVRDASMLRMSTSLAILGNPAGHWSISTFPPDRQPWRTTENEAEWVLPAFIAWQLNPRGFVPPDGPWPYHVGGSAMGPATLEPPPTPPELLQAVAADQDWRIPYPGGGAYDFCFDWHPAVPGRSLLSNIDTGTIVYYWGATEGTAIHLEPGETFRATHYLYAYPTYPLRADLAGPFVGACNEGPARVAVSGSAWTLEPTSAELQYRWSSTDPRVSFIDETLPDTEAVVDGAGTFPVRLTVAVGPYESIVEGSIEVEDVEPPRFLDLSVTPDVLWSPNHRLVPVTVTASITDDCDPAPRLRLVSVTSSEPSNGRGDGNQEPDIHGADIGTDDRSIELRAERDGRGRGRTYRLTYEAVDAAGNASQRTVDVRVPRDMRGRPRPRP